MSIQLQVFPQWYDGTTNTDAVSVGQLFGNNQTQGIAYQPVLAASFNSVFQTTNQSNEETKIIFDRSSAYSILDINEPKPVNIQDSADLISGQKVFNPVGDYQSHEGHSFFISNQLIELCGTTVDKISDKFKKQYDSILSSLNNGKYQEEALAIRREQLNAEEAIMNKKKVRVREQYQLGGDANISDFNKPQS